LRLPKDKKRYGEAWSLQQEIAKLSHSAVNLGRQLESQAKWMPLPITAASANEALGLEWEAANSGRELAVLDKETLPPKEKKDQRKYLLSTIAENRKRSRSQMANASIPFEVQDGEMRAAANTPGKSVYELVATADVQTITALRIEVLPTSGEAARHNPEDGFIVDQVEAWAIQPNGHQDKIHFRYFVPDSEDDLRSAIARAIRFGPMTELAGGFAANPNLFRAHWTIGLPDSPLKLTRGSRIKMRVTQTQNVNDKPAHVKRARLSASSDSCWSALIRDQEYRSNLMRLSTLTQQLKKIPSVETPVMAEQPDYE
jgi:hypothetical protein